MVPPTSRPCLAVVRQCSRCSWQAWCVVLGMVRHGAAGGEAGALLVVSGGTRGHPAHGGWALGATLILVDRFWPQMFRKTTQARTGRSTGYPVGPRCTQ